MSEYVDGFVIVVPAAKLAAYRKMARQACQVWMEYGALDYRECVSEDLSVKCGTPFEKLTKLKSDELIVFAWITYRSKAQRNKINAKVMADPRIQSMCEQGEMPCDPKRMSYGGFKTIVAARA
ncbi:DUF1428 domain-containing protein [Synoicihabitans lomoniglobus]|uniref:DUF1428 domain-containing protein n=1 Tax=Synoicihabitans lomoniglobus TaxID=2909285 RepID=A0AAE9ZYD5_9BACT|nr:DUF1428 domain-containing protein [Opitutaceae bacterium LMO-M01]WED63463.1 DUF1428 domain-containing protein [Opitutaceae bacterium LMO-M01]